MNIDRKTLGDGTTVLTVTVGQADYREAVDKTLRSHKRKANIPGFRPGMVPMGLIDKMYRKSVTAEESYHTASTAAFDYLEKENIRTVGDMIPGSQQKPLDFDNTADFEFVFEVGAAPEVKLALGPEDKVRKYEIAIDKTMRDGYRGNFLRRYGRLVDADTVEAGDALTVTLDQEAMQVQEAYVGLEGMSNGQRKPFLGRKAGDTMQVDVNEIYPNPAQRASILGLKEEELGSIDPVFTLTITQIRRFSEPELNGEFFSAAFPDGEVKNAEEFDRYVDAQIAGDLARESDHMFLFDMRNYLIEKANLAMPEAFLKRWLFTINEGKFSMEEIEKDFPAFLGTMKWNLVLRHYVDELKLDVTPEEATEEAKAAARARFAYYGIGRVPDDTLENYARGMLENKEEERKIYDRIFERKVIVAVEPLITVTPTGIGAAEFSELAQRTQQ